MLVIGIETSGTNGSAALVCDGKCLEQRRLERAGQRHAQSLVLDLRELLSARQLSPLDVQAVAVSRGPGSFTGLRVGLVCAKTFAYATGCRFVAVDTFLAVATNCPQDVDNVWVVEDAQRGDLFCGHYRRCADGSWQPTLPVSIVPGEQWLAKRTSHDVIAGRGLLRHELSCVVPRCLLDDDIIRPQAATIAQLGERQLYEQLPSLSTVDDFDFWKAVPFYLRPSAAEEQRQKNADAQKL